MTRRMFWGHRCLPTASEGAIVDDERDDGDTGSQLGAGTTDLGSDVPESLC